jgi:hypothetical protein
MELCSETIISGISIHVYISPCAHTCRYCSIGDRKFSSITVSRLLALYDRFLDWKAWKGLEDFGIQWSFFGPSFNFDIETLAQLTKYSEQRNGVRWQRIPLGGLRMLPENEMRDWLKTRQGLGFDSVAASMAGHGTTHDCWNGREGDFEFMLNTQKSASELGMELHQGFFIAKSTLPILDETIKLLDASLGPPAKRYARLFMSAGHGAHREDERITEKEREQLPEWVLDIFKRDSRYLRSERELMKFSEQSEYQQRRVFLSLYVDDENIDQIEVRSCEEIFGDLEQRTRSVFSAMPSVAKLCESVGNRCGTKLYDSFFDLRRVWLDRYLDKHPLNVDWRLASSYVGKLSSKQPPPLELVNKG